MLELGNRIEYHNERKSSLIQDGKGIVTIYWFIVDAVIPQPRG